MNYEQKYLKYKNKYIELKNQLGGLIAERATYEYEVYKYCNFKIKELLDRNGYIKQYILDMCHESVYYFFKKIIEQDKYESFKKLYNDKTQTILSGAIDLDLFLIKLGNNVDDELLFKKIIKENFNIRSSLTFLDMVVKYIISRSTSFSKLSKFFDEEIRIRDARTDVDSEFKRDELCLNKFKIPTNNIIEKKLNHTCLPMVDLIEPYTELEKSKYSDDKLINFNVGRNIFTAPHLANTVDVFSAGMSGHTIDISLLFTTFIFKKIKEEEIYLIILSCLIWMLPYYHHSLREIVGIGFIFLDNNDDNLKKVLNLFKIKKGYQLDKQIFDDIFKMIEEKIAVFKNKKYTVDYPLVDLKKIISDVNKEKKNSSLDYESIKNNMDMDLTLFNVLLSKIEHEKYIKNRLVEIDTKGKMIKFLNLFNKLKDNKEVYIEIPF
jgi:hypothetical protein